MHRRTRRTRSRWLTALAVGAATALAPAGAANASIAHPSIVSEDPADFTPNVTSSGAVHKFLQVGSTMYAGGRFTEVTDVTDGRKHRRINLFSYQATGGAVTGLAPVLDGTVWGMASDGRSLWVAGSFTSVNGVARRGLVKLNPTTGAVDRSFDARFTSGAVTDVQLLDGRLLVGGSFSKRLVALNPSTGGDTGFVNVRIAGSVADNAGPTDVTRFAVNPAGTRMVIIGNFTSVGGRARRQAALINLAAGGSSVAGWYSRRWDETCSSVLPQYTRDVDWAPNGRYFVIVTTGGGFPQDIPANRPKLCDTASRWEDTDLSNAEPTWVNYTGGDSLLSVAATGSTVYVGGHQRWLDNPFGRDFAGPGAVSRPGIGSIHPVTGRATDWNPTKVRGVGTRELYATPAGLWVGSDTNLIGRPREFHAKQAFMPIL